MINSSDIPKVVDSIGRNLSKILDKPTFFSLAIIFLVVMVAIYVTPILIMTTSWSYQTDRIVDAIRDNCSQRFVQRSGMVEQ